MMSWAVAQPVVVTVHSRLIYIHTYSLRWKVTGWSEIQPDVFRNIVLKLGYDEMPGDSDSPCFVYDGNDRICFGTERQALLDRLPIQSGYGLSIPQGPIVGKITVDGESFIDGRSPLAEWLLSAYQQDIHPDSASDSSLFVYPEKKSLAGYRWRNLLSMGWGTQYAIRQNPFTSKTMVDVGAGYVFDALTALLVIGGPFGAHNWKQGLAISMVGFLPSICVRFEFFNSEKFKLSFALLNSSYRMPKSVYAPLKTSSQP